MSKVRVRIAPSPTGPLHIGTARTALFNFIFARQHKGDFVLRIEDTDKERSDPRFEKDIMETLKWLGLEHDEFYRQSERTDIYKKYVKKLLKEERAFYCYHTKEELTEEKKKQIENKEAPRHNCKHKDTRYKIPASQQGGQDTNKGIIRLKGSDKKIKFKDMIRGEIKYDTSLLGDISIAKSEDSVLYNLAVVVDDFEMKISHVIRGEDHIPNTPKQILIQEALGMKSPAYAHIPLTLASDRSKMSKRQGAISLNEYRKEGYLPESIINFLVLLGWSPGDNREILDMEELIKIFNVSGFQKGGAIFNVDKLNWFNKEYIKALDIKELSQRIEKFLPEKWKERTKKEPKYWNKILGLEKTRLTKLSEIKERSVFFFEKPAYSKDLLVWEGETQDNTKQYLDKIHNLLSNLETGKFFRENIKELLWDYTEEKGRGNVLWPFRVSLTGLAKSPDPFDVAEILGKEETLSRIKYALQM